MTKILLIEIPPHFLFLYLGLHYLGLWGIALALTVRFVGDFLLLTWAAGRNFRPLPVLGVNLALLLAAAYVAGLWPISDWRWWASAAAFGLATLAIAWRVLPKDILADLLARLRRAAPGLSS